MLTTARLKIASIPHLMLLLFSLFVTAGTQAQTESKGGTYFGIGLDLARATTPLSPRWKFGLGGSFLFEARVSKPVSITAALSYMKFEEHWGGRYNGSHIDQLALLPGIRAYFANYFFGSLQLGYSLHTDDYSELGGSVMAAPGLGFRYGKLDITARYSTASRDYQDLSYFSLRIGAAF